VQYNETAPISSASTFTQADIASVEAIDKRTVKITLNTGVTLV
jgi:ABC-type oligopeptide transport system substrate-binding subunit